MKEFMKKILPSGIFLLAKNVRNKYYLARLYKFDKNRFKSSSYLLGKKDTYNNLRSKITFHYHSIEKGLSNRNLRLGFGNRAFTGLFAAMDKYIELGYPTEDSRFQQAISTIEEYLNLHKNEKINVEKVASKYLEYSTYILKMYKNTGGADETEKNMIPDFRSTNFKELTLNRHSVRDFGAEIVSDDDILEAIEIATRTPSVCNRQAYRVYLIRDEDKLRKILSLQGGLTTHGENLKSLLLVTSNREYMNGPQERNQTYIDGGLFTMSLIYALTYKNLATCVLNANFSLKREKESRKILNISFSEDLIAFIAVGSYPTKIKWTKSPRDNAEAITTII